MERAWTVLVFGDTLAKKISVDRAHAWADSVGKAAQARGDRATFAITQIWHGQRYGCYEFEYEKARPYFPPAIATARALRDDFGLARGLREWAYAAQLAGELETAKKHYAELVRVARRGGYTELEGMAHWGLGGMAKNDGRYPEARRELDAARRQLPAGTFRNVHAYFLYGEVLNRTGQRDEARKVYEEVLVEAKR